MRKSGDDVERLLRDEKYGVGRKPEAGTVVMGIIDEGIAFVN